MEQITLVVMEVLVVLVVVRVEILLIQVDQEIHLLLALLKEMLVVMDQVHQVVQTQQLVVAVQQPQAQQHPLMGRELLVEQVQHQVSMELQQQELVVVAVELALQVLVELVELVVVEMVEDHILLLQYLVRTDQQILVVAVVVDPEVVDLEVLVEQVVQV